MKVLVSGATGLIGHALKDQLEARGDTVITLTRTPERVSGPAARWDPTKGQLDPRALDGVSAVVHLAGENIAKRWTQAQKRKILESRTLSTRLLAEAVAKHVGSTSVFVSCSAIGIYGSEHEGDVDESTSPGSGFLSRVCTAWEAEAQTARNAGVRVVHPRIGIVLSPKGGALAELLPPFRLGLGGPMGSGRQTMSWIGIQDTVGLLLHAIDRPEVSGPLNVTAPHPVTNLTFARTLAKVISRPAALPLPGFALKILMGSELAEGLFLNGARVVPRAAEATGYRFQHPKLEGCLRGMNLS